MKRLLQVLVFGFTLFHMHSVLGNFSDKVKPYALVRNKDFSDTTIKESSVESDDIKRQFDDHLDKIIESMQEGDLIHKERWEQLKHLRKKLKELKVDEGEKAKNLLKNIKETFKLYVENLLTRWKPMDDEL